MCLARPSAGEMGTLRDAVKPMLRREGDRIGGIGLKLHPDLRYANLYHWLVGDRYFIKGSVGHPLPVASMAYATGDRIP
jgi:hypothetical protein